jgi:hypothetical protein
MYKEPDQEMSSVAFNGELKLQLIAISKEA